MAREVTDLLLQRYSNRKETGLEGGQPVRSCSRNPDEREWWFGPRKLPRGKQTDSKGIQEENATEFHS